MARLQMECMSMRSNSFNKVIIPDLRKYTNFIFGYKTFGSVQNAE